MSHFLPCLAPYPHIIFPLHFPPSQTSSNPFTHLHPVPPYSTSVSQSTQLISKGFSTPFVFLSRLSAINFLEPFLSLLVSIAYFALSCHILLTHLFFFFFFATVVKLPPPEHSLGSPSTLLLNIEFSITGELNLRYGFQ